MPQENGDKSDEETVEEVVEVPHEIEVEEVREREVMQDVVETRKIPQVKAMYLYKGQGMKIEKGEVRVDFPPIMNSLGHAMFPHLANLDFL